MNNCGCKLSCPLLAVIASIIIGIIGAFLTISATITVTPAFLWVALGIAVAYLAIVLLSVSLTQRSDTRISCLCPVLSTLIVGILGTALLSVILLGITFAATSIVGAIFTGALLAFLSLTVTTTACLVKCLAGCDN